MVCLTTGGLSGTAGRGATIMAAGEVGAEIFLTGAFSGVVFAWAGIAMLNNRATRAIFNTQSSWCRRLLLIMCDNSLASKYSQLKTSGVQKIPSELGVTWEPERL